MRSSLFYHILSAVVFVIGALSTYRIFQRIYDTGEIFSAQLDNNTVEYYFCFQMAVHNLYCFDLSLNFRLVGFLLFSFFPLFHIFCSYKKVNSSDLFCMALLIFILCFHVYYFFSLYKYFGEGYFLYFYMRFIFILFVYEVYTNKEYFILTFIYILSAVLYFWHLKYLFFILSGLTIDFLDAGFLEEYSFSYFFPSPVSANALGHVVTFYPRLEYHELMQVVDQVRDAIMEKLDIKSWAYSPVLRDLKNALFQCLYFQQVDMANQNISDFINIVYPKVIKRYSQ